METKASYKSFRYLARIAWKAGRKGTVSIEGKPDIEVSSPPEFKGDAGYWTPEDLFISSLNTCIMESYLAFADRKGLGLISYQSGVEGLLEFSEGKYRFTAVTVKPVITVKTAEEVEKARGLVEVAHTNCFISNSTTAKVTVEAEILVG